MSADPLSFFAVADSESDDDSSVVSSDNETQSNEVCKKMSGSRSSNMLPAPLTALANAKTPEFVTSHISNDMNWDKFVKEAPYVPPKEFKPWETVLPSVEAKSKVKDKKPDLAIVKQVPQTLTPSAPKVETKKGRPADVKDHAVSWSKMYKDSGFDAAPAKRPRPEDEDEDLAGFCHTDVEINKVAFQVKHQKTANVPSSFREKEKRKRDVGQANREKSFVEEEKRILRQNFDS